MAFADATQFKDPIRITLVYFIVYYIFLYAGAIYKLGKGVSTLIVKKPDGAANINSPLVNENGGGQPNDASNKALSPEEVAAQAREKRILLTVERSQGNTLEQMPVFLLTLWLMAVFVSAKKAGDFGAVYIAFRFIYPICFYFGFPYILISTWPGYFIIFMMLSKVIHSAEL